MELALATTATPHTSISVTTPMTDEEVKAKCEDLDVHLKSRCAGLLEIHTGETQTWEHHRYFDPVKPTDKVNYLHRTIKDFLATEDVQDKLLSDCTSEFNPHTYVIHSFVSRLYRSVFITHLGTWYPASNEAVWALIARAMKHAKRVDLSGDRSYIAALDLLEHAGKRAWNFGQDPWKGQHQLPVFFKNTSLAWVKCDKTVMWIRNFVGETIIHNLFAYINSKVRESNILLLDQEAMPLFCYAFQQNPSRVFDPPSPEMVALLLQRGADPDQRWLGKSMWQKLFSTTWKYTKDFVEAEILPSRVPALGKVVSQEKRQVLSILAQILKLYLEYEADTVGTPASDFRRPAGAECFHNFDEASIRRTISRIYVKYLPSSSPELLHALQMKMARDQRSDAKNGAKREYEREDSYGPRKRFHGAKYSRLSHANPDMNKICFCSER